MILAATEPRHDRIWSTQTAISAREVLTERAGIPVDAAARTAPGYLQDLYRTSLLSPQEERLLFSWLLVGLWFY